MAQPHLDPVARRRTVVEAGVRGDGDTVIGHLGDPCPGVRASAAVAADRLDSLDRDVVARLVADPAPSVRRTMARLGAARGAIPLDRLMADDEAEVVEMAAWAAGERGAAGADLLPALIDLAGGHPDALVREAAVATLGAIGNEAGLPTILAAMDDKATVRRRAIIALAPFDTPEVDAVIAEAREDRDWQVRQTAEDLSPSA